MNNKRQIIFTLPAAIVLVVLCIVLTSCQRPPSRTGAHSTAAADEIDRLQAEIKKQPNSAFNHEQLAVVLYGTGDTDKAIEEIKTAIKLAPDNPGYHSTLGMIYEKQGKNQLALKSYDSCVKLMEKQSEPSDQAPLHYAALARMHDVIGNRSEAISYYNMALHSLEWPTIRSRFTDNDIQEMESQIKSRLDILSKDGS